jgi:hypothetical protein
MGLILKKEDVQKHNLDQAYSAALFSGSMAANMSANEPEFFNDGTDIIVDTEKANWVGTKEYQQHWNEIKVLLKDLKSKKKNTAQFPEATYYDLIEKISIDITKRRIQEIDYTTLVSQEQIRFDFSKKVDLQEFLGFVGEFQENNLAGDSVPLIEQKTGAEGEVKMQGYALGNIRSLEDVLYNTAIWSLQKINEAYTRAFIGRRNDLVFGKMIALTDATGWDAGQTVPADTTSGASIEEKVYKTVNAALEALGSLYDFQNQQEIDLSRVVIATGRNVDARKLSRAIRGQINNSKGINSNREPLEVDQIWMYKGDSFTFGKKKITYKGIAANKAYMFIPGPSGAPHHTLVKRTLTAVTSEGSALNFKQDAESRYFIQTDYTDEFYGSSSDNAVITANTDHVYGYIVEMNIPA